jgi:hypothetical protein
MAFVWSRLALAAVLAVSGAAATAAAACPQGRTCCDEAPRLACATELPTLVVNLGDRALDTPLVATASPVLVVTPRTAVGLVPVAPAAMPRVDLDVLLRAPKTSPPRA